MRIPRPNLHSENLATRLAELDSSAYREFADVFERRFIVFFKRHGLTPSDAEDLAATCITDIALKIAKHRSLKPGSFDYWVFTLARRALVDWWRDHQTKFISIDELTEDVVVQDRLRPNRNLIRIVRQALATLSEKERIIVQLRDLQEEDTYEEIGAQLGITANAARVRHFRALNRLRLLTEPYIEKPGVLRARRRW